MWLFTRRSPLEKRLSQIVRDATRRENKSEQEIIDSLDRILENDIKKELGKLK